MNFLLEHCGRAGLLQRSRILFFVSLTVLNLTAEARVVLGKVTRICDGDTIHIVTVDNVKFKVRLDRIDAPEKDQPFGKESAAYLASLIRGKTVRVEWQKQDDYGRLLGIVNAQEATARPPHVPPPQNDPASDKTWYDINLHMVATGHAWHYSYFDHTPAYVAAQAEAKEKKLGLWAVEKPINPYQWRKNIWKM